ncbi:MAG: four helix bundle protein [Balneolaceae bacterium]|nr:four helix bundle protein [Balneolaceae bacterium]
MRTQNIIQHKTYEFAVRVVKLHLDICKNTRQYEISRQFLRAGTSIGANTEEAIGAESKKDFVHKLSIAYKEARETKYWLRILKDTGLIGSNITESMLNECEEILAIIAKIKITTLNNMKT